MKWKLGPLVVAVVAGAAFYVNDGPVGEEAVRDVFDTVGALPPSAAAGASLLVALVGVGMLARRRDG